MAVRSEDEEDGDEQRRGQREELAEVAGEAAGQRPGGGEAGRQHADGDQERQDRLAERLVDVEGGTGRLGVLGHQLGVGEAGDGGDGDAGREGDPEGTAHGGRHRADQHVDAGAEDVAEDVEEQQPAGDRAFELALGRDRPAVAWLAVVMATCLLPANAVGSRCRAGQRAST